MAKKKKKRRRKSSPRGRARKGRTRREAGDSRPADPLADYEAQLKEKLRGYIREKGRLTRALRTVRSIRRKISGIEETLGT